MIVVVVVAAPAPAAVVIVVVDNDSEPNHTHTHTWRALGTGASAHIDDRLVWCLGVVGLECGRADTLAQPGLAVTLLDHLHLAGPLEQQHAVHAHPCGFAHSVHAARGLLMVRLRVLRGCGSAALLLFVSSDMPNMLWLKESRFI